MRSIGNRSEQTIRNWEGGVLGREGVKEEYNIGVIQLGSNTNFFPFMGLFLLFKIKHVIYKNVQRKVMINRI